MSEQTKDILWRAFKTFVQAFLASWALFGYDFSQSALLGAGSAGISAVWNAFGSSILDALKSVFK